MSFFKGLFGGGSKAAAKPAARAAAPTPDDSIKNMKSTKEMLEKKQAVLEARIEQETQGAKRLAALAKKNPTKKKEALTHLKRKKMYEGQFEQLSGQIFNLDQTIFALEKAITNKTLIDAQRNANVQLQAQLSQTGDADDVDDMVNDLIDNVSEVDDISSTLAQDVTIGSVDYDEDDLEAQLAELDEEDTEDFESQLMGGMSGPPVQQQARVPDMPPVRPVALDDMPVPPTHAAEEDDFAALEASMLI